MSFLDQIFRKRKKSSESDQGNILLSEDVMRKLPAGSPHPSSQNILVIGGAGKGHGFMLTRQKIRVATLHELEM